MVGDDHICRGQVIRDLLRGHLEEGLHVDHIGDVEVIGQKVHAGRAGHGGGGIPAHVQPDKLGFFQVDAEEVGEAAVAVNAEGAFDGFGLVDLPGAHRIPEHIACLAVTF